VLLSSAVTFQFFCYSSTVREIYKLEVEFNSDYTVQQEEQLPLFCKKEIRDFIKFERAQFKSEFEVFSHPPLSRERKGMIYLRIKLYFN